MSEIKLIEQALYTINKEAKVYRDKLFNVQDSYEYEHGFYTFPDEYGFEYSLEDIGLNYTDETDYFDIEKVENWINRESFFTDIEDEKEREKETKKLINEIKQEFEKARDHFFEYKKDLEKNLEKLYYIKDKILNKLVENKKAKVVGCHYFNFIGKMALVKIDKHTFHTPETSKIYYDGDDQIERLSEISSIDECDYMPVDQAIEVLTSCIY